MHLRPSVLLLSIPPSKPLQKLLIYQTLVSHQQQNQNIFYSTNERRGVVRERNKRVWGSRKEEEKGKKKKKKTLPHSWQHQF